MANWPLTCIDGQDSFLLSTRSVELALTVTGGMLGPVSFLPSGAAPIRPYATAPWAQETDGSNLPPILAALRGDWFCCAFGANAEAHDGQHLPLHGETANRTWRGIDRGATDAGAWMRLGVDLPLQGGRCEATTAILHDELVVYQRHDLLGLIGALNPGHHATLKFPDAEAAGRLSFSKIVHAHSYVEPTEQPRARGYSWLKPDAHIEELAAAPCIDGSTTDLTRYPARRGFEDIVILCTDPAAELGWSAVTFAEQGFAWFALRNPQQLVSTLLWFSNGGRHYPPWNGRHVNVLGLEDVTAFFHVGISASCRPNLLTARGVRTCLEPDAHGRISIPYIQGVVRIPTDFDEVATIRPARENGWILLSARSGAVVRARCDLTFLTSGTLPALGFS